MGFAPQYLERGTRLGAPIHTVRNDRDFLGGVQGERSQSQINANKMAEKEAQKGMSFSEFVGQVAKSGPHVFFTLSGTGIIAFAEDAFNAARRLKL